MRARLLLPLAGFAGVAAGGLMSIVPASDAATPATKPVAILHDVIDATTYYSGCNEVRALGKAPLYAGQPGYREEMDGDLDGIACEPYRG